ncbi:MAG TPA: multiheme c-type cytochrome [Myxococcota bacterium]|nr:multiheme c-type cytochrome [Myxococcota bacterium]
MARAEGRRIGILLGVALLAACAVPVPFAEDLLFSTERDQLPRAQDCERCHRAVYEEWSGSAHASAWKSPGFTRVTADHTAGPCLDCHAPGPLGERGEIALRADHREEGVTCVSCHLSTDPSHGRLAMRGPHERTAPLDVHPIVVDRLFLEPELCGTCHKAVLEEWKASPLPPDGKREVCQHCHMPAVQRTIESTNPDVPYSGVLVALARNVDGRRHLFAVPEDARDDLELRALPQTGKGLALELHNGLPHAIPTGAFGRREARVRVSWPGGERSELLRRDLEQRIAPGAARRFDFPDVPAGAAWRAALERRRVDGAFEPLVELSAPGEGVGP